MKVKVTQSSSTPWDPPHVLWNSPGQNTGLGSLSLLQGIFPTHGSNPVLLHCRKILYQLSHKGSPRVLECAAYPFSSRSFWPRNWTGVSCIADRFFMNWAIREVQLWQSPKITAVLFRIVALFSPNTFRPFRTMLTSIGNRKHHLLVSNFYLQLPKRASSFLREHPASWGAHW